MYSGMRASPPSQFGKCGAVGEGRNTAARSLLAICLTVVSAPALAPGAFGIDSGAQIGAVGSSGQMSSGRVVTPPTAQPLPGDASQTPASMVRVKWRAGKVSLDANGAPLAMVLQAVARETGIEIEGARGLGGHVCMHIADQDLATALKELLAGVDYLIAAAPQGSAFPRGIQVVIIAATDGPGLAKVSTQANAATPSAGREKNKPGMKERAASRAQYDGLQTNSPEENEEGNGAEPLMTQQPASPADTDEDIAAAQKAAAQQSSLAAINQAAVGGDQEALRNFLQDNDPAVQSTAFNALANQAPNLALDDLNTGIADSSSTNRLQSLQLLVQSGAADNQTVMTALNSALTDADPALTAYAIQALAAIGTADAMAALTEAFDNADAATKLMILNAVANVQAGRSLISQAVSDSDEEVSSAAASLLKQLQAQATLPAGT